MKIKLSWLWKTGAYSALLRSWLTALLLSFTSIALGMVIGAYRKEIADPIRAFFKTYDFSAFITALNKSQELSLFLGLLFVFGAVFGLREFFKDKAVREKENLLYKTLSTMPPGNFTTDLYTAYSTLSIGVSLNPVTKEEAEKSIRTYLKALLALSITFQAKRIFGARYGANIMILEPVSSFDLTEEKLKQLEYFSDGVDLKNLSAVLISDQKLSVSTDFDENIPDGKLSELVMPIPKKEFSEANGRKKYLPGAPSAFFEGSYIIGDTFHILDHYNREEDYDISHSVFKMGDDYFKTDPKGKLIKSFVSIKLDKFCYQGRECVGILNIHSNKVNLFPDNHTFDEFKKVTLPITASIAMLLDKYNNIQ